MCGLDERVIEMFKKEQKRFMYIVICLSLLVSVVWYLLPYGHEMLQAYLQLSAEEMLIYYEIRNSRDITYDQISFLNTNTNSPSASDYSDISDIDVEIRFTIINNSPVLSIGQTARTKKTLTQVKCVLNAYDIKDIGFDFHTVSAEAVNLTDDYDLCSRIKSILTDKSKLFCPGFISMYGIHVPYLDESQKEQFINWAESASVDIEYYDAKTLRRFSIRTTIDIDAQFYDAFLSPRIQSIFEGINNISQFPDEFLSKSSTTDLAKACLDHRLSMKIMSYPSKRLGFLLFRTELNGVAELLAREDLGSALVTLFQEAAAKEEHTTFAMRLAYMFDMPEVFYKLTQDQLQQIRQISENYSIYTTYLDEGFHEQLDQQFIEQSDTKELLEAILNSFVAGDFLDPVKPREFFLYALSYDNGLQELVRRDDAAVAVVDAFLNERIPLSSPLLSNRFRMLLVLVNQQEFALPEYCLEVISKVNDLDTRGFASVTYFDKAAEESQSPYVR